MGPTGRPGLAKSCDSNRLPVKKNRHFSGFSTSTVPLRCGGGGDRRRLRGSFSVPRSTATAAVGPLRDGSPQARQKLRRNAGGCLHAADGCNMWRNAICVKLGKLQKTGATVCKKIRSEPWITVDKCLSASYRQRMIPRVLVARGCLQRSVLIEK